jgi:ATP-dependent Clp protease adaptor protein ClpS
MSETNSDPLQESRDSVIAVLPEKPERRPERRARREPNYHVIIWNDEEHTYEYVQRMLMSLFGYSESKAYQITWEVDHTGKGIAFTAHMELAELKRDQILAYGADPLDVSSTGSLRATIEPAPE